LCGMQILLVADDIDHLVELVLVITLDGASNVADNVDRRAI
jgi:hypothetical protein